MPPNAEPHGTSNWGGDADVSVELDEDCGVYGGHSGFQLSGGQLPQVYLCCDLEATCDGHVDGVTPDGEPRRRFYPYENEVIEFPVEVVDARSGEKVGDTCDGWRFHTYVSSEQAPTEFCTKLTGISADTLRNAPPLREALRRLEGWLRTHNLVPWPWACVDRGEVSFVWVTDGQWDFGKFLWQDCRRKGIDFPFVCSRWCDIRKAFRCTFPRVHLRAPVLKSMVEGAGVEWTGEAHRGHVDAANLAALVGVLCKNPMLILPSDEVPRSLLHAQQHTNPTRLSPAAQDYKAFMRLHQGGTPGGGYRGGGGAEGCWSPGPPAKRVQVWQSQQRGAAQRFLLYAPPGEADEAEPEIRYWGTRHPDDNAGMVLNGVPCPSRFLTKTVVRHSGGGWQQPPHYHQRQQGYQRYARVTYASVQ
eukprot:TRINITY_DN17928_c0_g1_i1.p1 TRINITY_DN17928_c0_g1~~TRINITY_DN17928_c0_g1_i1.p1  ORF type:complete len:448 (+),score=132.24 TRINITY_DN17928_c0_g1_i1:94-1344(+)